MTINTENEDRNFCIYLFIICNKKKRYVYSIALKKKKQQNPREKKNINRILYGVNEKERERVESPFRL